jgi:hypothetical protein
MARWWTPFWLFLILPAFAEEPDQPDNPDVGPETAPVTTQNESRGIIPVGTEMVISTTAVTPTSEFAEKKLYDQAQEELSQSQLLLAKGLYEAASDTALAAYDNLVEVRMPRKKSRKLRAQRYQAATVYVQAGAAFIKEYVKRSGSTAAAVQEGRSRLEDLRDVARNYPDLNQLLNATAQDLAAMKPN